MRHDLLVGAKGCQQVIREVAGLEAGEAQTLQARHIPAQRVDQSRQRSAVYDALTNPTPVRIDVVVENA